MIDRAAILSTILDRQHLRRKAQLPRLDVRAEYEREVERAEWCEHVEQHHDRVRAQVLDDLRQRFGRELLSTGGRWALAALTNKALAESFRAGRST